MQLFEKKVRGETVYDGKIIRLERDIVQLQNGRETAREVVRHPGGVAILAVDNNDEVFFVEQYRYPVGGVLLELPAGKLEPGEDPAVCAARELEEECGHTAGKLTLLAKTYPSPGYLSEILWLFLAEDLRATQQRLDPDEFLTVSHMPLGKAMDLCMRGEITDGKTLLALLKYDRMRRG